MPSFHVCQLQIGDVTFTEAACALFPGLMVGLLHCSKVTEAASTFSTTGPISSSHSYSQDVLSMSVAPRFPLRYHLHDWLA